MLRKHIFIFMYIHTILLTVLTLDLNQCYHILCLFLRKLEFNMSEKSLHLINTA